MAECLRFCLIGCGRAGLVHARNLAWRTPRGQLAAVCDANPDAAGAAAREFGLDRVYADYREAVRDAQVDAVVVVTPTFLHREVACAAAEAGKHIFLEKPMAITVEECEAIIGAASDARVQLQIGFMRRFDERFVRAKTLVDSGTLGRVMTVKSTGRGPGLPPPWIYDLRKSNGILAEVNSHDFDSVRWFAGGEAARVYAEAGNFKCPEARPEFPEFYDNAVVNLRFANGVLGVIDGTCPCHYGYDARMEILCERGAIFIGTAVQTGLTHVTVDNMEVTGVGTARAESVRSWRNLFKDAYLAEMEHFVECVRDGRPPRVTGHDGLRAVETVVAANASLQAGAPITLREPSSA